MSLALFTIITEILSRLLTRAETAGSINGVKVSRTNPRVSHLLYDDDLIIYCKATSNEAASVARCLHEFCAWTGQVVNFHKSSIHYSWNVGRHMRAELCCQLGMHECDHKGSYLGLPYCNFKSKSAAFIKVEARLAKQLSGWKGKTLSLVGRSVLIKYFVQAIPRYTMHHFILPSSLLS